MGSAAGWSLLPRLTSWHGWGSNGPCSMSMRLTGVLVALPPCRSIGADVLIDDNVGYAMDCADAGIQVLLFDWEHSYPWSKLGDG
jgi:hypothetical protein